MRSFPEGREWVDGRVDRVTLAARVVDAWWNGTESNGNLDNLLMDLLCSFTPAELDKILGRDS